MEKKCRECGASTGFLGSTLFSRGGPVMPAETRFCQRCELVSIFVIEHSVDNEAPAADLPAFRTKYLGVERHGGLVEVVCPRCGESMFYVQHSEVSFRGADILAESWICECGATLETASDRVVSCTAPAVQ